MGLDITAYGSVDFSRRWTPPAGSGEDAEPDDYNNWVRVYANPDFPTRAPGIETGHYWAADTVGIGLRAGSYSSYGRWRARLKEWAMTLWTPTEQLAEGRLYPFYELINFSDCEGVLGPEVCAVLARDFKPDHPEGGSGLYGALASAFNLAANTGCVCFH